MPDMKIVSLIAAIALAACVDQPDVGPAPPSKDPPQLTTPTLDCGTIPEMPPIAPHIDPANPTIMTMDAVQWSDLMHWINGVNNYRLCMRAAQRA